jgi:inhibitor of cysteine peptidase
MSLIHYAWMPCMVLALVAGTGKKQILTQSQNGSKIKAVKGSEIQIVLDSNPTTGFTWQVVSFDSTVIRLQSEELLHQENHKEDEMRVGTPSKQLFKFKALNNGKTKLQLHYQRPWEKTAPSANQFSIEITVPN